MIYNERRKDCQMGGRILKILGGGGEMNNVCGTCKHYNEWENGYCDKINAVVEPEEYQCKEFENDTATKD